MNRGTTDPSFPARFECVDAAAAALCRVDADEEAVRQRLKNEIVGEMLLLERYYFYTVCERGGRLRLADDIFSELYLDCVLECLKKYRPDKTAKFTTFFRTLLEYRVRDKTAKHPQTVSLDASPEDDDGEKAGNLYNALETLQGDAAPGQTLDAMVSALLLYIVELLERLCEGSGETRVLYYRLFYTTRLVDLIKSEPSGKTEICLSLKAHEREAVGNAEKGLIAYTYAEPASTIDDLYWKPLKTYCQLPQLDEKSKSDKVLDLPFRNKVLLAYLAFAYDKMVSDAMLSKMKKRFDSDILAAKADL